MNRRGFLGALGAVAAATWVKSAPTETTKPLGTVARAKNGYQYVWVKAFESLSTGDWVGIDEDYSAKKYYAGPKRIGVVVNNAAPGKNTWAMVCGETGMAKLVYPYSDGERVFGV